jgi:hypothetical protein
MFTEFRISFSGEKNCIFGVPGAGGGGGGGGVGVEIAL